MKRLSIYGLIISVISLLSISCDEFIFQKELDLSHLTTPPKLVVNSIVYAGNDTNELRYTYSYPIFDPKNGREIINTDYWGYNYAFINDRVYYLPDVETDFYINEQKQTDIFEKDSIHYVRAKTESGQNLRIEAQWKDQKISAVTSIPTQPDFSVLNEDPDNIVLLLKDEKGVKNYFRIFLHHEYEIHFWPKVAEKHNLPPSVSQYYSSNYITYDPILTWGNPENDNSDFDVTSFEQNYLNIFSDDQFADKETELKLQRGSNYYYGSRIEADNEDGYFEIEPRHIERDVTRYYITIQALSEELYNYYAAFSSYYQMNDYAVEPIRMYGNIEGGLGIFGAINEKTVLISETTTEYEEY